MSSILTTDRSRFLLLVALLVLSIAMWTSWILMPVKLFVVFLHELSHALAALLTGGSVERIEINSRIGGLAVTRGGWGWLVISSGYVGSMLLGSLIVIGSVRGRGARVIAILVGGVVLLVTLLFVRNAFGLLFGCAFGGGMLAAARWLPRSWMILLVQYLGAMSCLYALVDVAEDLLTLQHRVTDASIMAASTGIPAIVWGILWSAISLVVFILTIRFAWRLANRYASEARDLPR